MSDEPEELTLQDFIGLELQEIIDQVASLYDVHPVTSLMVILEIAQASLGSLNKQAHAHYMLMLSKLLSDSISKAEFYKAMQEIEVLFKKSYKQKKGENTRSPLRHTIH